MKNIIIVIALVCAIAYAIANYDVSKDASMHNCTQQCALDGCVFEVE